MESPPEPALRVIHGLHAAGFEAYLVGGCVRDRLIDRAVNDWDVATNAVPEAVIDLFPKCIPTGLQHGTVTVVEDHMPIEVTTYRIEVGHTDGRRPDAVHFTRSLKEDLARRDFTVNAMAWDPTKAAIVDPFGGQADLAAKVIRAVGAPIERFSEDGLRPMRAIRFAAVLKMVIEPATLAAIPETIDTFRRISAERIRVEFEKTVLSSQPGWGLKTLRDVGLLGEFFPSVANIVEFERMTAAVDAAPPRLEIRLAVMIREAEGNIGALKTLRFPNKLVKHVLGLHSHRGIAADIKRTPEALRRLVAKVGRELLDNWLLVGQISAKDPADWATLDKALTEAGARDVAHQARELSISGQDVMRALDIPPSRQVRVILERALARVWADPNLDTPERLLALLPELAES